MGEARQREHQAGSRVLDELERTGGGRREASQEGVAVV